MYVPGTNLTQQDLHEWENAPYACPKCLTPFIRWSACIAHISLSSKPCHRVLSESTEIQLLSRKTAENLAGSLRVPASLPCFNPRSHRQLSRNPRLKFPQNETPAEIQHIKDEIEKAVFGKRYNNPLEFGALCSVCKMSEANCFFSPCGHSVGACHSCTVVKAPTACSCGLEISGFFKN